MKNIKKILAGTLIVSTLFSGGVFAETAGVEDSATSVNRVQKGERGDRPERVELTEEQIAERAVVRVRADALRAEGNTKEEIDTILESEGFEVPPRQDKGDKPDRDERPELTEEQKAERTAVKARVEVLRAEGKTREEIGAILESEGFELPNKPDRGERAELTEEQIAEREVVRARADALRAEGKTKEEIDAILESEGFEVPPRQDKGDRLDRDERPELTEEQIAERTAVKARVEALRAEGKTREEIGETLESEGFELPTKPARGGDKGEMTRPNTAE